MRTSAHSCNPFRLVAQLLILLCMVIAESAPASTFEIARRTFLQGAAATMAFLKPSAPVSQSWVVDKVPLVHETMRTFSLSNYPLGLFENEARKRLYSRGVAHDQWGDWIHMSPRRRLPEKVHQELITVAEDLATLVIEVATEQKIPVEDVQSNLQWMIDDWKRLGDETRVRPINFAIQDELLEKIIRRFDSGLLYQGTGGHFMNSVMHMREGSSIEVSLARFQKVYGEILIKHSRQIVSTEPTIPARITEKVTNFSRRELMAILRRTEAGCEKLIESAIKETIEKPQISREEIRPDQEVLALPRPEIPADLPR